MGELRRMQETVQTLINTIKAVENTPTAGDQKVEVDEGAVLVNRLVELEQRLTGIEAERDQVKEEIIQYARARGIQRIVGAEREAVIKNRLDIAIPSRHGNADLYEQMLAVLRKSPLWPQMIDFSPAKLRQLFDTTEGQALRRQLGTIIRDQEQQYVALKQKQEVKRALQVQEDNTFRRVDASVQRLGGENLEAIETVCA